MAARPAPSDTRRLFRREMRNGLRKSHFRREFSAMHPHRIQVEVRVF